MKGNFVVLMSMALFAGVLSTTSQASEMPPCESISARFVQRNYVEAQNNPIDSINCRDHAEKPLVRDCDIRLRGMPWIYTVSMQLVVINNELTCIEPPISSKLSTSRAK